MNTEVAITIRQAIPTDAQALVRSIKQMRHESAFVSIDEAAFLVPLAELEEQLAILYDHSVNLVVVALYGQEIVGLVTIRETIQDPSTGELGIVVKQAFWGMGLGTILLEEAIQWFHEQSSLMVIELIVYRDNQRAIHMYQKQGFHELTQKSTAKMQVMRYQKKAKTPSKS